MTHGPVGNHTFPTIQPDSQSTDHSDDCFRPLFQSAQGNFESPATEPCSGNSDEKGNDPLAVALKESYDRGVEAGNKEACGLAQKELDPSLKKFFDSLSAFSSNHSQLTHDCALHIIALALAISKKIVKGDSFFSSIEMSPIQQALNEMLQQHHQLNLKLNGQDLNELADLMRCRNIEMSDAGAVQICGSDTVNRGTSQFDNALASIDQLKEHITQALENLPDTIQLKKASTS